MPHQNRVTPFGDIIATPERGTMYGNRGCLVNAEGKIARPFRELRWIICVLDFKERKHPMMAPGRYTGLFFLDEATALAAGHRPCAECQRGRFDLFRETWSTANPDLTNVHRLLAPVIDKVLHSERLGPRQSVKSTGDLPDGTFVTDNGTDAYLVWQNKLLLWTPSGYKLSKTKNFSVEVLTPRSIVNTLGAGYPVAVHSSAASFR